MIYQIYKKNPSKLIDMNKGIIHTISKDKVACGLKVDLTNLHECKSLKPFGDKRKHCQNCNAVIYGF